MRLLQGRGTPCARNTKAIKTIKKNPYPHKGHSLTTKINLQTSKYNKRLWGDFPGSPVVKNSPSNAVGAGLIPGQGAKIPYASRPKSQKKKQKEYCNKFNKDFKNGPHQKKKKKIRGTMIKIHIREEGVLRKEQSIPLEKEVLSEKVSLEETKKSP